jgi:phage baseplate assembly protein W
MRALQVPFRVQGGKVGTTTNYDEIVRGQVIDALMTNQGERVFRPHYGCDLQSALFDPRDELERQDAASIVRTRLANANTGPDGRVLLRASIRYVIIETSGVPEAEVDVKISYQSSSVGGESTLTIPLPSSEFFGRTLPGHIEALHDAVPPAPL